MTLKPRFGDADLAAFTRSATSTADDEQIIGRSRRNGRRKDSLMLRNPSRRSRAAFVVAYIDARHARARLPLRPQRAARQATLIASLPWTWVAGSAASASPASSRP